VAAPPRCAVLGHPRGAELIIAIIILSVTGLTPLTGALALAVNGIGTLGKWGYEAVEAVPPGPIEAARRRRLDGAGAALGRVVAGAAGVPVVLALPVRDQRALVAVLGLIGVGGIGDMLTSYTQYREWSTVGMLLIVVIVVTDGDRRGEEGAHFGESWRVRVPVDAPTTVRIAAMRNGLQPTERRVADLIVQPTRSRSSRAAAGRPRSASLAHRSWACQSLGYRGYPPYASPGRRTRRPAAPRRRPRRRPLGELRALARAARSLTTAVSPDERRRRRRCRRRRPCRRLTPAGRREWPVGSRRGDLAMRLTAVGRPAEVIADAIAQQIAARRRPPTCASS
jgi:hypothetical protein